MLPIGPLTGFSVPRYVPGWQFILIILVHSLKSFNECDFNIHTYFLMQVCSQNITVCDLLGYIAIAKAGYTSFAQVNYAEKKRICCALEEQGQLVIPSSNPQVFAVGSIAVSFGILHQAFLVAQVNCYAIYLYGMKTPVRQLQILDSIRLSSEQPRPRRRFDIASTFQCNGIPLFQCDSGRMSLAIHRVYLMSIYVYIA